METKVAIIGRPNVGKSTIFNRLTGRKQALVHDIPGLTRDRKEGTVKFGDIQFTIIDTAGLEQAETGTLEELMMQQTHAAIKEASIVLMVIDGREGVTEDDKHFARIVRKYNKPTITVANKAENEKKAYGMHEAIKFGFGDPIAISAEHNIGLYDLLEAVQDLAEKNNIEFQVSEDVKPHLQIAIVGRPNAGKSTLFNQIIGEHRSITSDYAGTTRDSIYVNFNYKEQEILLVDTAGIRRRTSKGDFLEELSVSDSEKAIQYANVAVLLVDGEQGLNKIDLSLADKILEEGRGLVIAINKWDTVEDKKTTLKAIEDKIAHSLAQGKGTPILTISALEGKNCYRVLDAAFKVYEAWNSRITTAKLNRWLEKAVTNNIPPLSEGKRVKLKYATQVKERPPTIAVFSSSNVNDLPNSYIRYLVNSLRESFDLFGSPVRIMVRKTDNPFAGKVNKKVRP
jgi:GTPase